MKRWYALIALLWGFCAFGPHTAHAAISSATASISTHTITRQTNAQMTITVTNTDPAAIRYIRITRPGDAVSITGAGSGWSMSWDYDYIQLSGGTLTTGNSIGITIDILSGASDMVSTPWGVVVSDSVSGTNPFTPTGDVSFTVSGPPPDTTPPIIANISLATTYSSFTVSWTTAEAANGTMQYGTTDGYGLSVESSAYTLSHSLTATGLAADTVYYFRIDSQDASGNSANSHESYLVTSDTQPTNTPTHTPTPTSGSAATVAPTLTPTPTPIPDRTEPLVILHNQSASDFRDFPSLRVTVSDESGIADVYYSVNGAAFVRIAAVGTSSAKPLEFSFTPRHADASGSYAIQVKAVDRAGNSALSERQSYVIDRDGPRILVSTSFRPVMEKTPRLRGTVQDASGIATVEYSADAGTSWRPMPSTVTDYGVEFETDVHDPTLEGTYSLIIRGTDSLGNQTITAPYRYTVDRLPPESGGVVVLNGTITLSPESVNRYRGMTRNSYRIILATAGGVNAGYLVIRDTNGMLSRIPVVPSVRNGFWEAQFAPTSPSRYAVSAELDDGIHQKKESALFTFDITGAECVTDRAGRTLGGSWVRVFAFDEFRDAYARWNAEAFDQKNPSGQGQGCYSYLLPQGKYRLEAGAAGYTTVDTNTFEVKEPVFISQAFELNKTYCMHILWFSVCSPLREQIQMHPAYENSLSPDATDDVKGKNIRGVDERLDTLIQGKETEIIFLNTWIPDSDRILEAIEAHSAGMTVPVVLVFPLERDISVASWMAQSGFRLPAVSDADGKLGTAVGYHAGPVTVHISSDGVITDVQTARRSGGKIFQESGNPGH